MRPDANHIALIAVRNILGAARPFELDIEGTRVTCSVTRSTTTQWPEIESVSEAIDGPWPPDVSVGCSWEGGRCMIVVGCHYWQDSGKYRHRIGLRARLKGASSELVWTTVASSIGDEEDGYSAQVRGNAATVKRKAAGSNDGSVRVNNAIRALLRSSNLPLPTPSNIEICKIALPSGVIEPDPGVAFRRLVHLALIKLDFLSRGQAAAERGTQLINVAKYLADGAGEAITALEDADVEDDAEPDVESTQGKALARLPLNLILYGPPGTGKTFRVTTAYLPRFSRLVVEGGVKATVADYTSITFHQAFAYEDFIEGIRPTLSPAAGVGQSSIAYELKDGLFKTAVINAVQLTGFSGSLSEFCALAPAERKRLLNGAPPYALFVDEINRGNVARIFGELITLLEDDKRLGGEREMIVTLPYSRSAFGVPSNLHVIGTMNTADRSVEALDAALRRRFEFEELAPDPSAVDFLIEDQINVSLLLKAINRRIEKLLDRDHTIGHAFFVPLRAAPSIDALKNVFKRQVLPLLQEYFFGDWGKIGLVLGSDFVVRRPAEGGFAEFDHDERELLNERLSYELANVAQLTSASFRRIYQHVADD